MSVTHGLSFQADAPIETPLPNRIDVMTEPLSVAAPIEREICGHYRGIDYRVASRHPYSGIGWTLLFAGGREEDSGGAFYDDAPDHPEGAFAWAESAVKRRIDKIHEAMDALAR